MTDMIAAVRVRGPVDVSGDVESTMESLGLNSRNSCVLVDSENDAVVGMLNKVSDYITFGVISEETVSKIEEKHGEASPGLTVGLHPPKGGFKDTKAHVNAGGALGRRQDMDELLHKML